MTDPTVVEGHTSLVTSSGGLGADDLIDWSQLGPAFTAVSSPATVSSTNGLSATVTTSGGTFGRRDQSNGWSGNFEPGTPLLWDAGGGPDITITFATPVAGVGAQIQANSFGSFTAEIQVFDADGVLIGDFTEDGESTGNADASAIFIGVLSVSADIAKVTFDLTSAPSAPNDFAIGPLYLAGSGGSPVVSSGGVLTVSAGQTSNGVSVLGGGTLIVLSGGTAIDTVDEGTEIVSAGGTDFGAVLSAGGTQDLFGTASGVTVLGGSEQFVESGGVASGTTVSAGGTVFVSSGGVANNTGVASGGTEIVSTGGADLGAQLFSGGTQDVFGTASGVVMLFGGNVQYVESGGAASATIVNGGDLQVVYFGGSDFGATLNSDVFGAAVQDVFGTASGVAVLSGSEQLVEPGGVASGTTVSTGGTVFVSSGGTAIGAHVNGGELDADGSSIGATLDSGGRQYIRAGGVGSGTAINAGATETVLAGGSEFGATISGDSAEVDLFGSISGAVVDVGGRLEVFLGGTATDTTVNSGGRQDVAGIATGAVVNSGGYQRVEIGGLDIGATVINATIDVYGTASATTVESGSTANVWAGGLIAGATLNASTLFVYGLASAVIVNSGSLECIDSGGIASGTTVNPGGRLAVLLGGTSMDAAVSGGAEIVSSGGFAGDTTIFAGGTELVSAGGVTSDTTIDGGTLELADGAAAVGAILFVDSGGVLQIDDTTMPAATISGFTSDDTIDLRGVGGGVAGSATLDNGNVLTVHEGGVDYALQLDPAEDFTGDSFLVLDDNFGGTRVLVVESGIIVIGPGETVVVSGGQVVGNLDVFGTLVVGSGGIVLAADVESGGTETVAAGGLDISGTVESGGSQDVFGTVSATILIAGGRQTIEVGGIADGVVLDDAAVQDVFGFAGATIVSASDMQVVESGGVASGTTVSRGGVETVLSGGLTRDTVVDGGALDLQEGSEAAGTIAFAAIGSVLRIDGATMPTATITGFERGDVIDLADLSPGSGSTVTFDAATGILTISASTVETLTFSGIAAGTTFGLADDGNGGTLLRETPPAPTGLALSPSSDTGVVGDNATSIKTPVITGFGEAGDTVSLFDGDTAIGTAAVQADGQWSATVTVPLIDGTHFLSAIETDAFGIGSPASIAMSLTIVPSTLFNFVFTYNDGADYYSGTVVDDGSYGYQVGQTIVTSAGQYEIFADSGQTSQAPGTVSVLLYSHGGPGQASTVPVATASGQPDGLNGLGSESDAVLGLDGIAHPFGSTLEASFQTSNLYGFVYAYADGTFYTGSVADNGSFGIVPGDRVITGSDGQVIGTYTIYSSGITSRAAGTVVVDRFVAGGFIFVPTNSGEIAGTSGIGSEQSSITVNGLTLGFTNQLEPSVTVAIPTVPTTPAPDATDVIVAEINVLYQEVLGRNPDPGGVDTYSAELAAGMSVETLRTTLAQSPESQSLLNQLYHQIFGRDIDPGGAATYTGSLVDGSSLAGVQLILAQSPEAQSDLEAIYQQVLWRQADGGGLTTYMGVLGDPANPMSLAEIRSVIAHSPEASGLLGKLVQDTLGRPIFAAELAGMEDALTEDGISQQTLASELLTNQTAGDYVSIFDVAGSTQLTGVPSVPTLFAFTDMSLASDTIVGFDPTRDTIQLPDTVAADTATVLAKTSAFNDGSLIAFSTGQTIAIGGITPDRLGSANFIIA